MRLEIRAHHPKCNLDFASHAERRLRLALSRFTPALKSVRLTASQTFTSGLDVCVHVRVRFIELVEEISLESLDVDPFVATETASESAARLIAHTLRRGAESKILSKHLQRNIELKNP
jgi:hypothetical protein